LYHTPAAVPTAALGLARRRAFDDARNLIRITEHHLPLGLKYVIHDAFPG